MNPADLNFNSPRVPVSFDWETVDAPEYDPDSRRLAHEALGIIIRWIVGGGVSHHRITLRAVALCWVVCRPYFGSVTERELYTALGVSWATWREAVAEAWKLAGKKDLRHRRKPSKVDPQ